MPVLKKNVLGYFLARECDRELFLELHDKSEHTKDPRPDAYSQRSSKAILKERGGKFETTCFELIKAWFTSSVHAPTKGDSIDESVFLSVLSTNFGPCAIIQPKFKSDSSVLKRLATGTPSNLRLSSFIPDLLLVRRTKESDLMLLPDGAITKADQEKLGIQVVDVKLSAELYPGHHAEVVLYSLTLAHWLETNGLSTKYYVKANPGVWHDQLAAEANLSKPASATPSSSEIEEFEGKLNELIDGAETRVFISRIKSFLQEDIPRTLVKESWTELPWHVASSCRNCDYLGPSPGQEASGKHDKDLAKNTAPDQLCMRRAIKTNHLSRIPFLQRGARAFLEENGIHDTNTIVAQSIPQKLVDANRHLKANHELIHDRAKAIAGSPPAGMRSSNRTIQLSKAADRNFYVSCDVDSSTGIALHFTYTTNATGASKRVYSFVTNSPTLDEERVALEEFLESLKSHMNGVHSSKTIQVYFWERRAYEYVQDAIGRHLNFITASSGLSKISWLFPPEDVVDNHELVLKKSAITVLKDPISANLAIDQSFYYTIFDVARQYHSGSTPPRTQPNYLWVEPLSDTIPPERIHEFWESKRDPTKFPTRKAEFEKFLEIRHECMERIAQKLHADLDTTSKWIPPRWGNIKAPACPQGWSDLTRLLMAYAKLGVAISAQENMQILALPWQERQAKFHSLRLLKLLEGDARAAALEANELADESEYLVYETDPEGAFVKAKKGDFLWFLNPLADEYLHSRRLLDKGGPLQVIPGMLDSMRDLYAGVPWVQAKTYQDLLRVGIKALDRHNNIIILEAELFYTEKPNGGISELRLDRLMRHSAWKRNFSANVMLDPIHQDFATPNFEILWDSVQNPENAIDAPEIRAAIGRKTPEKVEVGHRPSIANVYWAAETLARTATNNKHPTRPIGLNDSQFEALTHACSHELTLIWGPPGTGKTHTLAAIAKQLVANPGQDYRLLITAHSYTAIDNVLRKLVPQLDGLPITVTRVRSKSADKLHGVKVIDAPMESWNSPQEVTWKLESGIHVVAATPAQAFKLLNKGIGNPLEEYWDAILLDEGSQMDVQNASLAVSGRKHGGRLIVAGDHYQLQPIQRAKKVKGLDRVLGSVYDMLHSNPKINPHVKDLNRNYRSNQSIVDVMHLAGYKKSLQPEFPEMKLDFTLPPSSHQPSDWSPNLTWEPQWESVLRSDAVTNVLLHEDQISGQNNEHEALAICAMIRSLTRDGKPIIGVPRYNKETGTMEDLEPDWPQFWSQCVGVVTPHRAQRSSITTKLIETFDAEIKAGDFRKEDIEEAVDTVERFQGQERDIVFGSYVVGDPDVILSETEFLHSFHRFNVMASRARLKFILLAPRGAIDHLSSDRDILQQSDLIKTFTYLYCNHQSTISPVIDGNIRAFEWRRPSN